MRRPAVGPLVAVALPPLLLAAVGVTHPEELTNASADYWHDLHVALLPLFPLLALAPWVLVRGERRAVVWLVAALGYVFAVFYTGLDVISGIGAGALQSGGAADSTQILFDEGHALSTIGVYAFLAATSIAAGLSLRRVRIAALPGAVLVVAAAIQFLDSHIYPVRGVVTMLALAAGWTALLFAVGRAERGGAGAPSEHRAPSASVT